MIISRYLVKEIFITLLATTLILLLIFTSEQLLSFLRSMANGRLSLHALITVLSLHLPVLLSFLLPLSLFLSILLAYGRLYIDREMTVLFAFGVSRVWLLRVALKFSLIIALIVAALSFWIAPKMEEYTARIFAANDSETFNLLVPGRFTSVIKGKWIFYVENVTQDPQRLFNVFAAEDPMNAEIDYNQHASGIVFSKSGYLKTEDDGSKFLVLTDGNRYLGIPGHPDYQIVKFAEYGVRLNFANKIFPSKEKMLPMEKLWQGRTKPNLAAELNWRIALPIAVIVLGLLAVPLSKVNPRYGRYASIIPAILVYVFYANLIFLGRAWLTKGLLPIKLGMWWVHFIMLFVALFLLGRESYWQRVKIFCKKNVTI